MNSAARLILNTKYLILLLALAFLGFLISTYLTIQHYQHAIPPWSLSGCEVVLTSQFATIMNVPISLIGALYFVVLIGIDVVLIQKDAPNLQKILKLLIYLGFTISIVLFLIQAFILKAFCQYCLVVDSINILIFFLYARNKS